MILVLLQWPPLQVYNGFVYLNIQCLIPPFFFSLKLRNIYSPGVACAIAMPNTFKSPDPVNEPRSLPTLNPSRKKAHQLTTTPLSTSSAMNLRNRWCISLLILPDLLF